MKNALATFIYPAAIKYLSEFMNCLQLQSNQDFELIVFNDGVNNLDNMLGAFQGSKKIIQVTGTPTQVRFEAIDWLANSEYDKIVFQDIDDLMSENRVECLIKLLDTYKIVANDLSLMSEKSELYAKAIWSNKLNDKFIFDCNFISQKNILGIGNSAVRREVFQVPIRQSLIPLVADWFIYYQILRNGNFTALFTNQCHTYYRQHTENMAGVKELSTDRLNYVIKVKEAQYDALSEIGIELRSEKKLLNEQKRKVGQILNKSKSQSHFFWWDETSILN